MSADKSIAGKSIDAARRALAARLKSSAIDSAELDARILIGAMLNLDPDSAAPAPEVMKAVVRAHQNTAGIYGTVTRTGRLAVGQTMFLRTAT